MKKAIRYAAFVLCLLLASPALAGDTIRQSMTVDEAYSAIPHGKTRFDSSTAVTGEDERKFLDSFFGVIDLAVAERVIWQTGKKGDADNYDAILARLAALDAPERAKKAYTLVTEAIAEQRQYLAKISAGERFNAGDALVQSSHRKLFSAYTALMGAYPDESQHNKSAFFDHLCALDFI